ncbi:MAG: acyltransferase [Cytophagales bacterium]|nr:acyltransferase [Cytophagales bacterium]
MKKLYFPNLDGLRFFAFLAVFFAHSFYSEETYIQEHALYQAFRSIGHLGIFGVNFFFVLSGFLITFLLINEKESFGTISLRNFYIRRVLRIWPLYYFIIAVGFFVIPTIQRDILGSSYEESANIWHYVFFINNFFDQPSSAVLGVLWSIAIEEQFYLFWPVFIKIFTRRYWPAFFLSIIVFSAISRTFYIGYGYQHTLSCISDLAIGSMMAYFAFYSSKFKETFSRMKFSYIAIIYVLGGSLFFFRSYWADVAWLYLNERLLFSLFFSFIILEQCYSEQPLKLGRLKLITNWGKISYGLYMLHFVAIYIVAKVFELIVHETLVSVLLFEPMMAFVISILLAFLSFNFFESYFLSWKKKFNR